MGSLRRGTAVALVTTVALAACGGGKHSAKTAPTNTTTVKPKAPPAAPLTGLPDTTGARQRCAITVKIDNTKSSQPKYSVEQADVVY